MRFASGLGQLRLPHFLASVVHILHNRLWLGDGSKCRTSKDQDGEGLRPGLSSYTLKCSPDLRRIRTNFRDCSKVQYMGCRASSTSELGAFAVLDGFTEVNFFDRLGASEVRDGAGDL